MDENKTPPTLRSAEEWAGEFPSGTTEERGVELTNAIRREAIAWAFEECAKISEDTHIASDWSDGVLRGHRMAEDTISFRIRARAKELDDLDREFHFADDPCPLGGGGGLERSWKPPVFVNPPYSEISAWMQKGWEESARGPVVMLIPSRTDTRWWHNYVMHANQIRFIRGRLKFGGAKNSAPFPSAIVVFDRSRASRAPSSA